MAGAHHPLAELAERQYGVVSIRQLAELGYSRNAVSRAVQAGRLHRLKHGVYAVGHRSLVWRSHCLAAVLACGPDAVASHSSAARLWGLLPNRSGDIHITVPTRRHAKAGVCVHFANLADDDRTVLDGIPATGLPRVLLDIAATGPALLDRCIERSEELRLFDLRAVDALLDRAAGRPGSGRLRQALAIYRDDPTFTRSGLERRFLALLKRAGLPTPVSGHNVVGYELDVYWEAEGFAVELDVYETHGSRAAFERDRLRHEDLKLAGVEMIRITGPRFGREPNEVVARVAALLEQRRRQLDGEAARPRWIDTLD